MLNGLLILTKLNYFQKFFNKALSRFSGRSGAAKKHPGARILFHERVRFRVKNKIVLNKNQIYLMDLRTHKSQK
ncbi:uncharacterized protein METZ01_LOCUS52887 [marine metagenome]|uniref:Uncharacterized protein n=1 Tax=marine metagenome TaxID=408172 RepID=A0A381SFS9_9ZZZZ